MSTEEVAEAFNSGCQSRLDGLPCVPPHYAVPDLKRAWLNGWVHVHQFWGSECGGWPIRRLPVVGEVVEV
jgi:hypothetical protein